MVQTVNNELRGLDWLVVECMLGSSSPDYCGSRLSFAKLLRTESNLEEDAFRSKYVFSSSRHPIGESVSEALFSFDEAKSMDEKISCEDYVNTTKLRMNLLANELENSVNPSYSSKKEEYLTKFLCELSKTVSTAEFQGYSPRTHPLIIAHSRGWKDFLVA